MKLDEANRAGSSLRSKENIGGLRLLQAGWEAEKSSGHLQEPLKAADVLPVKSKDTEQTCGSEN